MTFDDPNDKKNKDSEWLMERSREVETGRIITTMWKRSYLEKKGII